MKKHIAFFTGWLATISAFAQIQLQASDLPALNDTVRYSTSTSVVNSLLNISGPNQTWDASFIQPNFQELARYQSPLSINILYFATFNGSTYGTKAAGNISAGIVQGNDVYEFYKRNSSYFIADGRGFSVQEVPLSQTWKDTVFRFPVQYGDTDSNEYESNEVNAVVATMRMTGKRVNVVDGWGSITTPYGTFNCLRIKSTIRTTDSIRTSLLPITIPITQTKTVYSWYAKSQKLPILEITVPQNLGGQTSVRFRDRYRPEAFEGLARFTLNKNTFASNAGNDTCVLNENSTRTTTDRTWTITPNTYQFTGGTDANSKQAKILFTQPGTYTVTLRAQFEAGYDDTTRVDVITVGVGPEAGFTSDRVNTNTTQIVSFSDTSTGAPDSWKWTFDPNTVSFVGGTSDVSQNPKVIFDASGTYSVTLRVQNAIGSNTVTRNSYIHCFTTGVNELNCEHLLVIYPNPAQNQLTIQSRMAPARYRLFDLTGKLMIEGNGNQLSVLEMENGMYLLEVELTDGSTVTRRLLVSHP